MYTCAPHFVSIKFPDLHSSKTLRPFGMSKREFKVFALASSVNEASNYIPAAPILIPEGPWNQIPGGVTAAKGFKAVGIYGGLRAKGEKPDLALVTCDVDAAAAGSFTTNMVAAAPVLYCKHALDISQTARAVLINAGQANAATGDAGYQDVLECADTVAMMLKVKREEVLIESTGVIGQRIKKDALLNALPTLVNSLTSSVEGAGSAAVAITTTDLVSKSVAIESQIGGINIRVGGMAKGSGMIHPNMATMLGVITTDALVQTDVWRKMVQTAVNRSFNQITVDGDTSTNDTVIALASGLSGSMSISSIDCTRAIQLQACLDAVMQGLAKSIAWDGEGATCLIEVTVAGTESEVKAAKIARSVASSSLVKAAVYGRDPNWGRIAAAAGYAGIPFHQNKLRILLGDILLMDNGQPLAFDRPAASKYLKMAGETHGTVKIYISVGDGSGIGKAWGCDLSYDYVKINAEYTT
ncbi:arginine biosynthesis bifunctional protein ArgJ, chloroplastic [Ricinus communis]|uniref:Arginine biosynthesis bifunctional protein ArgJ, chloroplastic n=1 Tax=Ricinus communis TaxID=3988 RepID=ARGJ_RICCO|nr:arginine biosynthesis bifunctional protein ArgJ, chloroplastic [Ricinus communis]XP_015582185.1 arginine biosynthesis bifunctional protein ArgJ, chloroplastic [Ricinus communis]XP_048226147.1 arginine biosynthesis bifunctional protein ArgJ, chloroplastic [Ricinus communis]B9SZB6.1 RecName: Full=Arginine biosynthesis bifunctional protein ArgJ, chloroplastic; Includes: RecName: Full=Glutamate N-acetyltransferase; Short=GAT; AltName: Full=Ornithine acetyltransferase; Short=OATase; AltName: Full=|eukprot:XP_002531335.1 arginine biosynthesis bifunctional protein ArgJ, chloroplastic [Ricinus communis]